MKKNDALRAAVVGLGVGRQHALTYNELSTCHLSAVFDTDTERATRIAGSLGVPAAEAFDDLVESRDVDLISIASYDQAHFEQTVAALQGGKHVFVEKPLCRSLSELEALKRVWSDSAGRHLQSNLVLRAAPLYGWLREAIGAGELGEIYAIDGDYLYGRLHKITEGWRRDVVGYSVMKGGGIHLVDLMLWLTGQRPDAVSAIGNGICTRGTAFSNDDFVAATFTFESGLIGRVTANFGCVHRHFHALRVFGTKRTFISDDQGPRLLESRDPTHHAIALRLAAVPDSKGALIPPFVDGILAGADPRENAQSEFDLISVCSAADRALEQANVEKVNYV